VQLGGLVDERIHGVHHEVRELHLHDRTQPGHRGPDGHPDDRVLADRRVPHTLLAELAE
jgi:hypothetical protein